MHWIWMVSAISCAACTLACAADYPVRSIRYIVPQGAGGSSRHAGARSHAETFGKAWASGHHRQSSRRDRQHWHRDRRACSAGWLYVAASRHFARDNPALSVKMPFDPIRDFAPITLLSQSPNLWIVHPSLPVKNMRELVALAKNASRRYQLLVVGHRLVAASGRRIVEVTRLHIDIVHIPTTSN